MLIFLFLWALAIRNRFFDVNQRREGERGVHDSNWAGRNCL